MVKKDFTSILNSPPMMEEKDVVPMMELGDFSKSSMVFTLIIPFAFMMFMSVSMDSVWSMYLMMQIVSNLMHIFIQRPGNAEYIMFIGEKISYFKITEEENVKQWMKMNM